MYRVQLDLKQHEFRNKVMQIDIFLWLLPLWNKNDWPLVMQYMSWQEIGNKVF
jgi:hypothetical protein